MSRVADPLPEPYISVLEEYFAGGEEAALQRAYELGREAMLAGKGVLEVTESYHQALTTVLGRTKTLPEIQNQIQMAATLFAEILSPFEMFQRGFQEIDALRRLNEELAVHATKFESFQSSQADSAGMHAQVNMLHKAFDNLSRKMRQRTAELVRASDDLHVEIAERRRVEESLRVSQEGFQLLVDGMKDYAIFMLNPAGRIVSWNDGAERIYGYQAKDVLGRHFQYIHTEEDIESGEPERRLIVAETEGRFESEGWRVHRDGTRFWANSITTALRAMDGQLRGFSQVTRDITERKRLEEQLLQTQKLESVGRLAGGIAHDFNNLLTVILGFAELANEECSLDASAQEYLHNVIHASEKAAGLTRQLLAFARKQMIEPRVVNLNDLILSLNKMLRRLIGENIELVMLPQEALHCVKVDPGQFEQILVNLVVNAHDAMPDGGKITLETRNTFLDEEYSLQHGEVAPGEYILLTVSDTGSGMDEAVRLHIFEPFFTTKEKGRGTGLGLATVYGIIKQAGGHIWLYSEPGEGTTFKIYLPRTTDTPENMSASQLLSDQLGGSETVLLVEDEPSVRMLAAQALGLRGYIVLEAGNGEEALRGVKGRETEIALLVTDVVMPHMNGQELAERLQALNPQMKVLFASGYTENTIVHHGVLDPGIAFLSKPFTPSQLARKVREILDGGGRDIPKQ